MLHAMRVRHWLGAFAVVVIVGLVGVSLWKYEHQITTERQLLSALTAKLGEPIQVVRVKGIGSWRTVGYVKIPTRTYTELECREIADAIGQLQDVIAIIGLNDLSNRDAIRRQHRMRQIRFASELIGARWESVESGRGRMTQGGQ